jgi:hypothetical protein
MSTLFSEQANLCRMRPQTLWIRQITNVVQVVGIVCGLQAQDLQAATLSIWPRSHNLTAADVRQAIEGDRSIIRTWVMRGTLHLVAAEDLDWMLSLFGPVFSRGTQRRRLELGLDDQTSDKAVQLIDQILAVSGPLTRAELAKQLEAHDIPTAGQAIAHAIGYAALQGVLCFGPGRNGKPTYVRLEDWIKRPLSTPSQDEALPELARRYLNAYGPATTADLASWSGLLMPQVRQAWGSIADELLEVEIDGRPTWMLQTHADRLDQKPPKDPIVRLLPAYDTYLLGYKSRDFMLDPAYARRVHPGGGLIRPTLLVNGRIEGTWKLMKQGKHQEVVIESFEKLTAAVRDGVEEEVKDLSRFLEIKIALRL